MNKWGNCFNGTIWIQPEDFKYLAKIQKQERISLKPVFWRRKDISLFFNDKGLL